MYDELLSQIDDFFAGKLGLQNLELWVVGNLQRFLDDGDQPAVDAINRVNLSLVQLSDDVIDSQEFTETLREIEGSRAGSS